MRLALCFVATLASLVSGCAYGRIVPHSTAAPQLGSGEGLLAVALDSNAMRVDLMLCRGADLAQCMPVGPLTPAQPLVVLALPADEHCLVRLAAEIDTGGGVVRQLEAGHTCMHVGAGELWYPGHLVFNTYPTQTTAQRVDYRWQVSEDALHDLLVRERPELASHQVRIGRPHALSGE